MPKVGDVVNVSTTIKRTDSILHRVRFFIVVITEDSTNTALLKRIVVPQREAHIIKLNLCWLTNLSILYGLMRVVVLLVVLSFPLQITPIPIERRLYLGSTFVIVGRQKVFSIA